MPRLTTKRSTLHAKRYARANDLLFEIGTEELPAAYAPGLLEQLGREADALLRANHLAFRSVHSAGTPRRLVLIVKGLAGVQEKPGEELRGPSKQAAYDAAGKPTKALEGFLRSQGGTLTQTKLVASPKGEYVYLLKPPTATPTVQVLPALLPQLIGKLRAPKTMCWDASGVRFARPIRWLLSLYGRSALRVSYGRLASGQRTRVGRPQQLRWAPVSSIESYFSALKRAGIILEPSERRARIEALVSKEARALGGVPAPEMLSYGLLDEVVFLTEQPVPLVGAFDPAYLQLPREVLLASMAKHQRVFAIEAAGKLLPRCIAILEGKPGKPLEVRKVVERILNARLADSALFLQKDLDRSLDQMAQSLSGLTFHERLGSMADKTERIKALTEGLAGLWHLDGGKTESLKNAARLAKADLVSNMVREFPSLQGVIGKYYAGKSGYSDEVAQAIEQQYWLYEEPSSEEERLRATNIPGGDVSMALTIAEKYDTLASYFGVGIEPSGSTDPFGLRRCATALLELANLLPSKHPLLLSKLFELRSKFSPFTNMEPHQRQESEARINKYILERLYNRPLQESAIAQDTIQAVLASHCDDLVDVLSRVEALHQLRTAAGGESLLKAAKVIERTRNILKGAKGPGDGAVEPSLLKEPQEQELWQLYGQHKDRVSRLIDDRRYDKATTEFGELFYEPLHRFFDKVLVNDPDAALQKNRLALMRAIHRLYTDRIADLSKLTVLQREESS